MLDGMERSCELPNGQTPPLLTLGHESRGHFNRISKGGVGSIRERQKLSFGGEQKTDVAQTCAAVGRALDFRFNKKCFEKTKRILENIQPILSFQV